MALALAENRVLRLRLEKSKAKVSKLRMKIDRVTSIHNVYLNAVLTTLRDPGDDDALSPAFDDVNDVADVDDVNNDVADVNDVDEVDEFDDVNNDVDDDNDVHNVEPEEEASLVSDSPDVES